MSPFVVLVSVVVLVAIPLGLLALLHFADGMLAVAREEPLPVVPPSPEVEAWGFLLAGLTRDMGDT